MIWAWCLAYGLGVLASVRPFFLRDREGLAQAELAQRESVASHFVDEEARRAWIEGRPLVDGDTLRSSRRLAWLFSLLWLLTWAYVGLSWAAIRVTDLLTADTTPPTQRAFDQAIRERAELKRLRVEAREMGLDQPGVPDHTSNGVQQYRHKMPCPLRMETGWGGDIRADPHAAGHDWYACPHATHLGMIG